MSAAHEIQAMVDRETAAWNACDAEALVDLFHPDCVWPWPPDADAHDPATWVMPLGRFDRGRWKASWEQLFATHVLVHNYRTTVRIEVSAEGDGAFAVVDVDTLWRQRGTAVPNHWAGRACKVYTRVGERWYFIFQTGLLQYRSKELATIKTAEAGASTSPVPLHELHGLLQRPSAKPMAVQDMDEAIMQAVCEENGL